MSEHTAGPWIMHSGMVWKDGPDIYPKGKGLDGIPIARMDREWGNGTQPCERDANARLIAAAPDLLKVCKGVRLELNLLLELAKLEGMEQVKTVQKRIIQVNTAIAKTKET